jgi:predicted CoA-substrate-specific enzyme activase
MVFWAIQPSLDIRVYLAYHLPMTITAGVDVGAITAKAAIFEEERLLASAVIFAGYDRAAAARQVLDQALEQANLTREQIACLVATGYGRVQVPGADRSVTEITCHARGAHHLCPDVRTVIDIGGQDSKGLAVGPGGKVVDFVMNDKCAAGTGRFLEAMARTMGLGLGEMDRLSAKATRAAVITSMCSVFAESEVINLINDGVDAAEIIKGLHNAMAGRVASLARRVGVEPDVMVTGGVAKSLSIHTALTEKTGAALWTFPGDLDPQIIGALGAAVIAAEKDVA